MVKTNGGLSPSNHPFGALSTFLSRILFSKNQALGVFSRVFTPFFLHDKTKIKQENNSDLRRSLKYRKITCLRQYLWENIHNLLVRCASVCIPPWGFRLGILLYPPHPNVAGECPTSPPIPEVVHQSYVPQPTPLSTCDRFGLETKASVAVS